MGLLREELQELAEARTEHALNLVRAKVLDGVLLRSECETRQELINQSLRALEGDEGGAAAGILGDGDLNLTRWSTTLTVRRKQSADLLGLGPDAFRRRDRELGPGSSHYDRLIEGLATALLGLSEDLEAPLEASIWGLSEDFERPSEAPSGELSAESGSKSWRALSGAGIALIGLLLVGWAVVGGSPGGSSEAIAIGGCDVPLGGVMSPTLNGPKSVDAALEIYQSAGGLARLGCPGSTAQPWGSLWVQPFPDGDIAGVFLFSDSSAFFVESALFEGYRRVGGDDGGNAQGLGGLPVSVDLASESPSIQLDNGSLVVAETLGLPGRWMPEALVDEWFSQAGAEGLLGSPMADLNYVDGDLYQEFAGGYAEHLGDGSISLTVIDLARAEDHAARLVAAGPGIIRMYDDTAYFVGDGGTRRWIPSAEVWFCLGGETALITEETVPGWVVGVLPLSGVATC